MTRATHRNGASALALAMCLGTAGLTLVQPALAQQADGARVIVVPVEGTVVRTTDGVPSDAGTAQALADDDVTADSPTEGDTNERDVAASTPSGEGEISEAREGTERCVDVLSRLEGDFTRRQREAQDALLTVAAADPLVLRMADGSAVDLRPADLEGGPTENWFGDPPRRDQVSAAIDSMRGFRDADSEAECLEAARSITASLSEWEGVEPVGDTAAVATSTPPRADDTQAGDSVASVDPDAATSAVTDGTRVTTADGDAVLLTEDEAAEVSATADDTGEGDDYGAPAATEQADVTGEETEAVVTAVETDPAAGTAGAPVVTAPATIAPADGEVAALGAAADDRTGEGAGAETPLMPLTTSDEANDADAVGNRIIPVGEETLDGGVADDPASAASMAEPTPMRVIERPAANVQVETPDGRALDGTRQGVTFRTVPIEVTD